MNEREMVWGYILTPNLWLGVGGNKSAAATLQLATAAAKQL